MDRWESLIKDYGTSTLDGINTVLQTAKSILKEDLAPFEFDWFIQTLLYEPVSLLATISARSEGAWSKVVRDAFDLLADLVDTHHDRIQEYFGDIVSECKKSHDARTMSHALACLTACVKHTMSGVNASQYIKELGQASTCKGPLALLVGTICEYHPAEVRDDYVIIWRNYLNMLTAKQTHITVKVYKSLLKGVQSLFKHFGTDIPITELNQFFENNIKQLAKSDDAMILPILPILREHSVLFKEKLAEDKSLRNKLWTLDLSAVLPVYEVACSVLTKEKIQDIIKTEVSPHLANYNLRVTALRLCLLLKRRHNISLDDVVNVDVYSLEFALRSQVSYEDADMASLCIEFNLVNSETLLQTSIMFYQNIPAKKRNEVVVNGLLNSPTRVMRTTFNFLITQTCQDDTSLRGFLPLWRDLFHSHLVERKRILFDMFIDNILIVIDNFLEENVDDKKLPEKLSTLLTMTSHVLTLNSEEMSDQCALISPKLVELVYQCGLEAPIVAVARSLLPYLDDDYNIKKIYKMIKIDKCKDEALLCESCLALIEGRLMVDSSIVLKAVQVTCSRKDAEAKTLSSAIHKLDEILMKENNNLDQTSVLKSIQLIEKLRSRKELVGKDARILQRDVTIFLDKYSNLLGVDDGISSEENTLIMELREKIVLDLPNTIEGTTIQINLHRLLHLALIHEDANSLRMFLNIICANLSSNAPQSKELFQAALGRVLVSLCRATAGESRPDVARPAASFCDVDATLYIIQQISEEKSPAVRSMLSDMIEGILFKEPGSEANETLLKDVYKEVCKMMKSSSSILKIGGLDITESLLSALKINRHQSKDMLPNLIILISKTNEQNSSTVFKIASELFIENIGLFSANVLNITITELLKISLNFDKIINTKVFKDMLKLTLGFVKKVIESKNEGSSNIICQIFELKNNSDSTKFVYLWAELPNFFDFKEDEVKEILDFKNGVVLETVFKGIKFDNLELEAHLKFFNQYASILLKYYSEPTLKHIAGIIEKIPPKYVKNHQTQLSKCLTHCRQSLLNLPNSLLKSFEKWSANLPLKEITDYVEKEKFISTHALSIKALDIILEIFDLKNPSIILTTVNIYAKTWTKIILKIYANDDFKYHKKHVPFLSDLLSVSLRFMTVTDVKTILLEGHGLKGVKNETIGVEFGRFFIAVFVKYLLCKPFVMLETDMDCCCVLLNDIVKWCVKKRWRDEQLTNLLQLVDELWPTYELKSTFKEKHLLLLDMSSFNVKLEASSRPMQWATGVIRSDASPDDKMALVTVLPGGAEYSETYRVYASLLPTCLSDIQGPSHGALRALLEALAGNADKELLDIIIKLSIGGDTAGWWDLALDSCLASLARSELTLATLDYVLSHSGAVCQRLLVPLLRYAPSSLSEEFFACHLSELLEELRASIKPPFLHPQYRECVQRKTNTLCILLVLLEKVPASKLESPNSSLYKHMKVDNSWHLPRIVIRACYKLQDILITPEGAPDDLQRICREFQQCAYNCMCACVCMRRPKADLYAEVFNTRAWDNIVDASQDYQLPLTIERNEHKISSAVAIRPERETLSRRRSSTSVPTRVFLRSLSENPLEYDLIDHDEDDNELQDIELKNNTLNKHPCAATLTALLQHAASLDHYVWKGVLCDALVNGKRNVRWLLAEIICNCREDLKSHATDLRPALLTVIADDYMKHEQSVRYSLNGLHTDILNTLIFWSSDISLSTSATIHLNSAVKALVKTALNHGIKKNSGIFKMLENLLENILKVYQSFIQGDLSVFETSLEDSQRTEVCLKLMLRFAKNNVKIPSTLDILLSILDKNIPLVAELIGIGIADSNADEKASATAKLKERIIKFEVSDFVKVLYYSGCCDSQQFRKIVDLTSKLSDAIKKKCLSIICTYIRDHPAEAGDVPDDIRHRAENIYGDKQFEDLFTTTPQYLNAKRPRLMTSPILNTIGRNEKDTSGILTRLGKERVEKLTEKLTKDNIVVRFVECFYLAIYLPMKYPCSDKRDLSACMSSFFQMLFSHLKAQDNFKEKKLRNKPLSLENSFGPTCSRTKKIVGTMRSFFYDSNRYNYDKSDSAIDVQVSIEHILDTFIQFAKITPDAAIELVIQLLRCLDGSGFDSRAALAPLLGTLITDVPEFVLLARECVDELCLLDGFMQTIVHLKKSTLGSDGEQEFRLLHEEVNLRRKPDLFVLGTLPKDEEVSMTEYAEFSIEGLVSAFQKLSNWNELTIQDKRSIEEKLPILWTDDESFKKLLKTYTDTSGWFGYTVQLYHDNTKDLMTCLRFLDKWPRRHLPLSSVIEAMQWHKPGTDFDIDSLQMPCDIQQGDCLAEWAARLMLRKAYLTDQSEEDVTSKLSRSHELIWCKSANERGLYDLAVGVIKRNYIHLDEDETLAWMEQRMLALTAMGLQRNDSSELKKALETADHLLDFCEFASSDVIVGINNLVMQINYKLESLSRSKIEDIMTTVKSQVIDLNKGDATTDKNKRNLTDLYQTAVLYYDGLWNTEEMPKEDILCELSDNLGMLNELGLDGAGVAAILLNRLDECEIICETTASKILAKLKLIMLKLPSCYLEQLKSKLALFPSHIVRACGITELQGEDKLDKLRQRLQLLSHADYLLLQYCEQLYLTLLTNDSSKWDEVFERMTRRIFQNEFAGSDFQTLVKYQSTFNNIQTADPDTKKNELKRLIQDLKRMPPRTTIRLTHVCPSLGGADLGDLAKLLRLGPSVEVLQIQEELEVYTDSLLRPCVVSVLTSVGRRRYLLKNEDLRANAAAYTNTVPYTVIPLSEDCGLIEFLEGHMRIRKLIATTCNIDDIPTKRQSTRDDELILAQRTASVQNYREICSKIPAYSLRSAIEKYSASVKDFITKKRRFMDTLADMTIENWLFGLGDRHLQNILYSVQDGGVQCIDYGAIFQYGGEEIPSARLTRNMLAVCDNKVLESKLQKKLSSLRETRKMILPKLKLSFKWMENFHEKLVYIEDILEGQKLSYEITKDVLEKSEKTNKTKYIELLKSVFEKHKSKEFYTVEEQVSCLLVQCTDPWILSVTRSGWEPWL